LPGRIKWLHADRASLPTGLDRAAAGRACRPLRRFGGRRLRRRRWRPEHRGRDHLRGRWCDTFDERRVAEGASLPIQLHLLAACRALAILDGTPWFRWQWRGRGRWRWRGRGRLDRCRRGNIYRDRHGDRHGGRRRRWCLDRSCPYGRLHWDRGGFRCHDRSCGLRWIRWWICYRSIDKDLRGLGLDLWWRRWQ